MVTRPRNGFLRAAPTSRSPGHLAPRWSLLGCLGCGAGVPNKGRAQGTLYVLALLVRTRFDGLIVMIQVSKKHATSDLSSLNTLLSDSAIYLGLNLIPRETELIAGRL